MSQDNRFNPDHLVLSSGYEETMAEVVLPFLAKRRVSATVKGAHGDPIYCVRFDADQPKGAVAIVHGFTENAYKFSELTYSLLMNGYSVLAWDQRGHGHSWRKPGLPDTSLTHVDAFEDYVEDMEIICRQQLSAMPGPRFVFCHSMGGAVTGLFLERHPEVFKKAALCAPMIAPNTGVSAGPVVLLCAAACLAGKSAARPFVSKPYSGPEDFDTSCATGRERFDWYDAVKQAHPEYQNSNPTYGWTREAIGVTKKLLAPGEPEKIACPVYLFTAEKDGSVLPGPQEAFIKRVKQGRRELVPGSKHEIYRSTDEVLFPWWHKILTFFAE